MPPTRYRRIAQASLAASAAALYLDENGLLQPWQWVTHTLHLPGAGKTPNALQVHVRVKAKPPPIGCTEWPAGRVLLQWAVNEVPPTGATVLEFGAGVGVTALGLALRSGKGIEEQEKECPTRIVATDICEASLENLRANAAANGIAVCSVALDSSSPQSHASLTVGVWDAVGGNKALERLRDDIGIDPCALTHVIGGDIMYHGFDSMAAEASQGLVSTLAALLHANPQINVTLLLVDRFSGSTVAAVSQPGVYRRGLSHPHTQVAGVNQASTTLTPQIDPAITRFEEECERLGLEHASMWVPDSLRSQVKATQTLRQRLRWFLW